MGIFKIFLVLFISFGLEARPISYSGGSTLMAFSDNIKDSLYYCLLYTSPSPRDNTTSRMPSSA